MLLVEDPEELRALSEVYDRLESCIVRLFGDAPRPGIAAPASRDIART
jgi:hypothetical protein